MAVNDAKPKVDGPASPELDRFPIPDSSAAISYDLLGLLPSSCTLPRPSSAALPSRGLIAATIAEYSDVVQAK